MRWPLSLALRLSRRGGTTSILNAAAKVGSSEVLWGGAGAQPRYAHQMRVPAGIRKSGPWVICLSGIIDTSPSSQFYLDRQANVSVFHEKLGLIISGANSKRQPELATFSGRVAGQLFHMALSSRLQMSEEHDRLALS